MISHIQLEAIGYDQTRLPFGVGREAWKRMPWVAEILGLTSTESLRLRFLERKVGFEESNSKMSRGVMFHFYPETGKFYMGFRRLSWGHSERFYFRVYEDGDIIEYAEGSAIIWAQKLDWGKTCSPPELSVSRGL